MLADARDCALSFIALHFSESDLIRTFGRSRLCRNSIAMIAVLMLVPLLGVLLVRGRIDVCGRSPASGSP